MEKNYNYNYENRAQMKSSVHFSNVELASCKESALKRCPVSNGMLWHTTDTNEFYFDWNGKRTKMNVSGDNASLSAEIEKIKADIKKMDPDAVQQKVNQLESKVNSAVSKVNNLSSSVRSAVSEARAASQAAEEAAASVADKADKSYVDSAVSGLASQSDLADYAKKSEIPNVDNFIEESDLADYAKKSDIPSVDNFVEESDLADYAKKSELPDLSNYATKDELPDLTDYATKDELPVVPENVSAFINDAGYLTTTNQKIPDGWNTTGTMADLIKDINEDDTAVAGKAYFGTVALQDLPDGLMQAEMKIEVMVYDESVPLDPEYNMYQKVITFAVTSSNIAPYHWEYTSSWGSTGVWRSFLTEHQSLAEYAKKSELPEVPVNVSEFTNDAGYLTSADLPDYLTESDLDGFAIGEFPASADADDETAPLDGYAKVQDVMDYVNALIEKKKDELAPVVTGVPYAYITGYALDAEPSNITVFNPFELNEEGTTEIEFYAAQEIGAWDPSTNEDLPSIKLTVDIPFDYTITNAEIWDNIRNQYSPLNSDNQFGVNPRYSSRVIDGVTYNSYARGPVNDEGTRGTQRYKITITK